MLRTHWLGAQEREYSLIQNFNELGLSPALVKSLDKAGFVTPTPIQAQAIPPQLQGRDILGIAQTGSGKTAGFTLPMIDILASGRARARMPRTLILEPTRELAAQVSNAFEIYGKRHKLSMALVIGGESMSDQERKLDRIMATKPSNGDNRSLRHRVDGG